MDMDQLKQDIIDYSKEIGIDKKELDNRNKNC